MPRGSGRVTAVEAMGNGRQVLCASQDNIRLYDLYDDDNPSSPAPYVAPASEPDPLLNPPKVPFIIVPGHRGGAPVSKLLLDSANRYMVTSTASSPPPHPSQPADGRRRRWEGAREADLEALPPARRATRPDAPSRYFSTANKLGNERTQTTTPGYCMHRMRPRVPVRTKTVGPNYTRPSHTALGSIVEHTVLGCSTWLAFLLEVAPDPCAVLPEAPLGRSPRVGFLSVWAANSVVMSVPHLCCIEVHVSLAP
ncbi:hypothetical protein M427DRAFT_71319 [Gonapodya prolifera JEL478]|uniref:Transcription factor spt8 beta-propeller domain-containing protein n=1 Tax=Gonapodya prolifera (strain JEL478) TaxID=1344416 RepID=A0A139AA17_GONPJ|nr:hypothetical protein M427DRAFT_71319 [Gonapodya prolifera JEL478]|eukprot:KXS13538.1 hypothetical protein M427DRAFT_71319 [Gonapodya prolifera JEL478]